MKYINLDLFSLTVYVLIVVFGLRTYIGYQIPGVPPHFMEFNMYVFDMSSESGEKIPDLFIARDVNDPQYKKLDPMMIKQILPFGYLFQGDRWASYEPLVVDFFCDDRVDRVLRMDSSSPFLVKIQYYKNYHESVEVEYEISCSLGL